MDILRLAKKKRTDILRIFILSLYDYVLAVYPLIILYVMFMREGVDTC